MIGVRRRPERFPLRVVRGGFQPADGACARRLADDRKVKVGDIVFAEIRKPRNPKFHRLAHAFGRLVSENSDAFEGMDAHRVLKRLQWESGCGCEEMLVQMAGMQATVRWPASLSFESMDEGEFHEIMRGLGRHVAQTYWPGCSEQEIAAMAEAMVEE